MGKFYEILKFKLNGGFNCKSCNSKMFFSHLELKGKHFLFQNHNDYMCTKCTIKSLNNIFTHDHKCDWCDTENVKTATYTKTDDVFISFGKYWWNGFFICKSCMLENIKNSKEVSGVCRVSGGKFKYLNKLGLEYNGR